MPNIFRVKSRDGTEIGCEVAGQGRPLLLVHGTADDRLGFDRLAPLIADRFTLYMMDRRGRGVSSDTLPYAIEREFDDIASVHAAMASKHGSTAGVFAHSYGALCAMGGAKNLDKLMLYEPPPGTSSGLVDKMVALDAEGDLEGVMRVQFCELQHQPLSVFERLRATPERWARYMDFAKTIAREFVDARRFRIPETLTPKVRFIVGEQSFPVLVRHTDVLVGTFPGADKAVLPGQGHNALRQGPETVAAEIVRFFG